MQVAAKSIFETSDRTGINQTLGSPLDPSNSPMGTSVGLGGVAVAGTTPENGSKRFEDDDTWRAKFLLKVQVRAKFLLKVQVTESTHVQISDIWISDIYLYVHSECLKYLQSGFQTTG